jgi:ABC-type nickel/cobalt efflux system permease component RcnA
MHRTRIALLLGICAGLVLAHPMGNFSVNHYARIVPSNGAVEISYVLDLGEVPTFDLLKRWNAPQAMLDERAEEQARGWLGKVDITVDGRKVEPRFESAHMTLSDGAAGMKTMRVEIKAVVEGVQGKIEYDDRNYPDKSGWKEIVIGRGADKSKALTSYSADEAAHPPQELRATFDAQGGGVVISPANPSESAVAPQPADTPTAPSPTGDYISRVLHGGEITFSVGFFCLLVAFGLGALHAFEPGHGKTMVAAYLVGTRGTPKHAVLLGLMTTFTHTVSVFLLGFVTLFLSHYIMPDRMSKVLGVISGLSIVWIGGLMLYKRLWKLMGGDSQHHHHHHHHHHDHAHPHDHDHAHDHGHDHDHTHPHHHVPEGDITMGSLIALGASGGLVPCPAALILLLSCISLGRTTFGMLLLLAFSGGLAIVLMATGLVVLYAKNLLPEKHRHAQSPLMRAMPVVSAAIIVVIGVMMTTVSLGWMPAIRFLG